MLNSTTTLDIEAKSASQQKKWFEAHKERHPILVAEVDNSVVGWCSLSPWSDRQGYKDTAEISTYIHPHYRGKGIGKKLKMAAIDQAKKIGFHCIISRVIEHNEISKELNEQLGFRYVGTMYEVGIKFGRSCNVNLYQLLISDDRNIA